MSFPAHSQITTEQRLSLPLNGTIYTSVRPVATEKPVPEIGATMATELGSTFANSRIIAVQKAPSKGDQGKQLVIRHAIIPDEEAQLESNWEFSTCDMGGTRYPSVSRTVVLLASAVEHDTPAKGSAMPFVPGDLFDGKGYILVDRQVVRSGLELEPTFRMERRNYVIKSSMKTLGVDSLNGKILTSTSTLYYATEPVIVGVTSPQIITVTGTLTPSATGTLDRVEDLGGFPQFSTAVNGSTYPATRCYYNGSEWVLSRHTGGSPLPYAVWTSAPCTLSACPSPAVASGWAPALGVGIATPTGTPAFTDNTVYSPNTTAAELFANSANAYWGLQSDGTQRTGRQLSCEWYEITSEVIVSGTFTGGAVTVRTYETTQSYYWPPVLNSLEIRLWSRRDGGEQRYVRPIFSKEGYRGECKAEVVDTFHVTAPAITAPSVMLPLPISIQNPFYGVSIGACLFAGATYSFTNGTDDLTYEYTVDNYTFPATSPVTWPDFITIINVQPFRGGYLRSTIKVFKPS